MTPCSHPVTAWIDREDCVECSCGHRFKNIAPETRVPEPDIDMSDIDTPAFLRRGKPMPRPVPYTPDLGAPGDRRLPQTLTTAIDLPLWPRSKYEKETRT